MKLSRRQTAFLNAYIELNHWHDVIARHIRKGLACHEHVLSRFEELLNQRGRDDGSIMLQEYWALWFEYRGAFQDAVWHRRRQIELIEQLFALGGPIDPVNHEYLDGALRRLAHNLAQIGEQAAAAAMSARAETVARGFDARTPGPNDAGHQS
jgi:hypothetical protein